MPIILEVERINHNPYDSYIDPRREIILTANLPDLSGKYITPLGPVNLQIKYLGINTYKQEISVSGPMCGNWEKQLRQPNYWPRTITKQLAVGQSANQTIVWYDADYQYPAEIVHISRRGQLKPDDIEVYLKGLFGGDKPSNYLEYLKYLGLRIG